jgi:hypothetical protein
MRRSSTGKVPDARICAARCQTALLAVYDVPMSPEGVAAGVSLIVGLITVLAAFLLQKRQFKNERQRQQDEFKNERQRQQDQFDRERESQQDLFDRERHQQLADMQRRMTERLYERRIAKYPELFAATEEFRRSVMDAAPTAPDLVKHLRDAIDRVNDWHAVEGGLLLSDKALQALYDLRQAVKEITEQNLASDTSRPDTRRVWECKRRLRVELREDISLLFEESKEISSASRSSGRRPPDGGAGMSPAAPTNPV